LVRDRRLQDRQPADLLGRPTRAVHRASRLQEDAARQRGALDWRQWWAQVATLDEFADDLAWRNQRFESLSDSRHSSIEFHVAALRQAGFREAAPIWQVADDYVVFAQR
jgi:hypothetical protein